MRRGSHSQYRLACDKIPSEIRPEVTNEGANESHPFGAGPALVRAAAQGGRGQCRKARWQAAAADHAGERRGQAHGAAGAIQHRICPKQRYAVDPGQLQASYVKSNDPDKIIATGDKLLAADPEDPEA